MKKYFTNVTYRGVRRAYKGIYAYGYTYLNVLCIHFYVFIYKFRGCEVLQFYNFCSSIVFYYTHICREMHIYANEGENK